MPYQDVLGQSGSSSAAPVSAPRGDLRTPGLIALIVVPLILLGTAVLLFQEFRREGALRAEVDRSYLIRSHTQGIFSMLQDIETGARGYTITGLKPFQQPYLDGRTKLPAALDQLDREIGPDADHHRRLNRLREKARIRLWEADRLVQARERLGPAAATAVVASGRGKALMDEIRVIVAEMVAADQAALKQRSAASSVQSARTRGVVVALFAFLAGVVGFAAWLVWRNERQRRTLLGEIRRTATRQRAVFESAIDGIVLLNPSGSIEAINRAGERMFGRRSDDLARRDVELLLELPAGRDGSFLQRLGVSREDLQSGVVKELTGRRSDGTPFPVDLALGAMELPDGLHVVAAVRDISERKRAERLKDEFVSTVSHELRTPLTSIAGSLGLLTGGAAGELPERAGRLIGIAHSNCQRLVRLINDILDIEKIESGKLTFEAVPLHLSELAAKAAEGLRGYADQHRVRIELAPEADPVVRGDGDRLIQVITNLVSNSVKFSPEGGVVEVTVSRSGHGARLSVRDHGPGVPDEFKGRIFSKFAQADSSATRQKGGTGLGLAIAKEIVDRHGGRLWFETAAGLGTTFHMDLPLAAAVQPHRQGTPGERILLCEDDPDIAAVVGETLEGAGFSLDVVETLAAARRLLAEPGRYAAVLMDLQLPDGDGISLIRELRDDEATCDLPVIVVSAYADRGREDAGPQLLNVVDWMEKPVDVERLRRVVQAALTRSGASRPTILHVDDDLDILQVTAATLAGVGEIVSVASLAAARAFLAQRTPNLVILDLGLPDGSGLDLLPALEDSSGAVIPVVVFSAQDMDRQALRAVDVALTKSRTSLGQLAQTVRRVARVQDLETGAV